MNIHRHLIPALLTATLLAGPTLAQAPAAGPAKPQVVNRPQWLRQPTSVDLDEYFPAAAVRAGRGGSATVTCTVAVTGLLRDCVVISETPRGLGLGAAAMGLSSKFQMRPYMVDGVATEAQISVPIRFDCRSCSTEPPVGSFISPKNNAANRNSRILLSGIWAKAPTFEQWKASYPQAAAQAGASGGVSFECGIRADGSLSSCAVKNETPSRMGFAAAARTLLPYFQATSKLAETKPAARVIVTIAYPKAQLDQAQASASPSLSRAITPAELDAAFPNAALGEKVPFGRAVVGCALDDGGAPSGCTVRSETPAGNGFGAAALTVAPKLRFNMWSPEGAPVNRTLNIPLAFGVPPRGEEDLSTLIDRTERLIAAGKLAEAEVEATDIQRRFPNDPRSQRIFNVMGSALSASRNSDARR